MTLKQVNRGAVLWDRKTGTSLASNISGAVGLALLTNLLIFLFPVPRGASDPSEILPGWVIGAVWTFLFAAMGAARWLVLASSRQRPEAKNSIIALILFCAAYPFYTGMLTNQRFAIPGNIATVTAALCRLRDLLAFFAVGQLADHSSRCLDELRYLSALETRGSLKVWKKGAV